MHGGKKMCNSCAFVIQATNSYFSSWFAWFEMLMKQLGRKMSLTQGIETRVIERVMKQILTNMLPNLFIAISAPWDVLVAECKQFGVCIAGDDFFETLNLPQSPSMRIRRKIYCLRLWMKFCFIHCNRRMIMISDCLCRFLQWSRLSLIEFCSKH